MALRDVHVWLGWVVVGANLVVGVWALLAHKVEQVQGRPLWFGIAVAQLLIAIQVVVGVVDMQRRDIEVSGIHLFYGFISLFTIGIIYSYQHQIEKWRYLLFGFGGLFLMGLAIRSMLIPAIG